MLEGEVFKRKKPIVTIKLLKFNRSEEREKRIEMGLKKKKANCGKQVSKFKGRKKELWQDNWFMMH